MLLGPIISRLFTCSNAEKRVLALVLSLCLPGPNNLASVLGPFVNYGRKSLITSAPDRLSKSNGGFLKELRVGKKKKKKKKVAGLFAFK